MATSDTAVIPNNPQDSNAAILHELRIITILLREGFNIKDENSSLRQQTLPETSTTGAP